MGNSFSKKYQKTIQNFKATEKNFIGLSLHIKVIHYIIPGCSSLKLILHLFDRIFELVESDGVPILHLECRFGLGVLHFDAVEEVADAEETDALTYEA